LACFLVINMNIIIPILVINLISWSAMLGDKRRSERQGRRVSENTLFLLALFGGAIGIYLGMFLFRHKTKKWYFVWGIPLLIAVNIYSVFLLTGMLERYNI